MPYPNIVFKYFLKDKLIELIEGTIELEECLMFNIDGFLYQQI